MNVSHFVFNARLSITNDYFIKMVTFYLPKVLSYIKWKRSVENEQMLK